MATKTIRELGGEIWSELQHFEGLDWKLGNRITDVVMGVLARHDGSLMVNDKDLPVTPLPPRNPDP